LTAAEDSAAENSVTGTPTIFVGASEDDATKVELDDLTDPSAIVSAVDELQ
jgi:protein-disulfide isomerase